jgi:hypothetical protein
VPDENKILKLVLLLDDAWFTLRINVNRQKYRSWYYENLHMVCEVSLPSSFECSGACNILGCTFFEETNSNNYVKLILTILFRELTEKEKM